MTDSSNDLLWEVSEIAKAIGRTERQTFRLLEMGAIPGKKVGGRWVASRKKLIEAIVGEAA